MTSWMFGGAAIALALGAAPASAETLREALAKAYQSNPTMTGARAGQRAEDENVTLARAQGRPSLTVNPGYTEILRKPDNAFNAPSRNWDVNAQLSVPIYNGGGVKNAIRAADTRVEAGQANLRGTEATVFSNVVAAYMDVLRDSATVSLNQNNVRALDVNLQATQDRFEVGDLTRTDVAQSEARLAIARSDLQAAEARLIGSKERYISLVGSAPDNLQVPPPLPNLPETPENAVQQALADNPDLLAATKAIEAARYDVRVAGASRMPRVSAVTNGSYTDNLGTLGSSFGSVVSQTTTTASVGVNATFPLYQGGAPSARERQAQARESQAIERQIEVERSVIAQTRGAYASWKAANEVIVSAQRAVEANKLSLEGVRAENSVGTRTILDILNAEQELVNTQVRLVTAQRDAYVAGFTLLAAMGQAEARDLGLEGTGPLYDPTINAKRVRNHIGDWDRDPTPAPVATRTVDTPAQNPSVTQLPK